MTTRGPKIALVSVELGRSQRGFERYFSDLFGVLRDELDVTLFKGGGAQKAGEELPLGLRSATTVARALPLGALTSGAEYEDYKRDCLAYGVCLLPTLLGKRFDVLHCIDPPLVKVLQGLQRIYKFRARLLFTEGCVMPPEYYPRDAHIHHVAQVPYEDALAAGVPAARMTLVPCGVHTERFSSSLSRQQLRAKYGLSDTTFVVLAVSAIKRIHKRVDYIVAEMSRLEGDVLLWLDGKPEEPSLLESAQSVLGARLRITHVPSAIVPELYRLADVLVHASLSEAFGLAIVEALCSGLPVLAHNAPHFAWLIGDHASLVDMEVPGNLAARLRQWSGRRQEHLARAQEQAARVRRRFDWRSLKADYVDMYRVVGEPGLRPSQHLTSTK